MTDGEFDRALLASAFRLIAERGWSRLSVAEAARRADLALDRARARFPTRMFVLLRFGSIADQEALALVPTELSHHERLLDILMRRFDVLQQHREGVLALLRGLPADPCAAAVLAAASMRGMTWMLDGAGIGCTGPLGLLRAKGLLAVWLYGVNAWRNDSSEGLDSTTKAVDKALGRAGEVDGWLHGRRGAPAEAAPEAPMPEPPPPAAAPPDDTPPVE
jgi:AcrR family transcriptional regulator